MSQMNETPQQPSLEDTSDAAIEVTYRSAGLGIWGTTLRALGMPLEKVALTANSSQVSGQNILQQAIRITFQDGWFRPYRVITRQSLVAWSLQYSLMGFAFQIADRTLSRILDVPTCASGDELLTTSISPARVATTKLPATHQHNNKATDPSDSSTTAVYAAKVGLKLMAAPLVASCAESMVSNKAEVTRFYSPEMFTQLQASTATRRNILQRMAGPAFGANVARNCIMSSSSFVCTPYLFMLAMPEEARNNTNLFWFGMSFNIFAGNVFGVMGQSLWGRSLDQLARQGSISYMQVIKDGWRQEGISAFLTPAKWGSRVLMNAPAQGTIPWFYNSILPLAEPVSVYWLIYSCISCVCAVC